MWGGAIAEAIGKAVDQTIDVGKTWLNYNSNKRQFADTLAFSREQLAFQKELLNNQLQWRVADAQKAGLHPMAAIGLSPSSFSPISAPSGGGADLQLGTTDFAGLGQNIDRAIMAGKTKEQREKAEDLQDVQTGLMLDKLKTENDILKLERDQKRWNLQRSLFPTQPALVEKPFIGGQPDASKSSYVPDIEPLMQLSSLGNVYFEHINPNISDAVTESMIKNGAFQVSAEGQAFRTKKEAIDTIISNGGWQAQALKSGHAILKRIPTVGWQILLDSRFRPRYSSDRKEVSGLLNPYPLQY